MCFQSVLLWTYCIYGVSEQATVFQAQMYFCDYFNSLWPSDTIWRHRSWSTLAQVMACCLAAPSHYLNNVDLHKYGPVTFIFRNFTRDNPSHQSRKSASICLNKISFKSPRGQWVKEWICEYASTIFVFHTSYYTCAQTIIHGIYAVLSEETDKSGCYTLYVTLQILLVWLLLAYFIHSWAQNCMCPSANDKPTPYWTHFLSLAEQGLSQW